MYNHNVLCSHCSVVILLYTFGDVSLIQHCSNSEQYEIEFDLVDTVTCLFPARGGGCFQPMGTSRLLLHVCGGPRLADVSVALALCLTECSLVV